MKFFVVHSLVFDAYVRSAIRISLGRQITELAYPYYIQQGIPSKKSSPSKQSHA
jgi:hypothetical protein